MNTVLSMLTGQTKKYEEKNTKSIVVCLEIISTYVLPIMPCHYSSIVTLFPSLTRLIKNMGKSQSSYDMDRGRAIIVTR